ncbi:MAG: L,D-transpeptidase/peptidoglycan binding protein [Cellulosilyticum sp.]|nr:L,D-transpeptidase/peptidoglycan binding protein [Cellulosilyticum sp.]
MNKGMIGSITAAIAIPCISIYAGATIFFKDSFHFGTTLGDLNIGGKSIEVAQMIVDQKGENFELSLYGKGVNKQKLYGKDFELSYSIEEDLEALKEEQNMFAWPITLVTGHRLRVTESATFNEELLDEAIDQLDYFKETKIIEPEDAQIVFNGTEYEIIPEVEGNKLNRQAMKERIVEALNNGKRVFSLEEEHCYEEPKFRAESEEFIAAKDLMNQYIQTDITYLFGSKQEKVTSEQISTWLALDETGEVQINEESVRAYVGELDSKYSTLGSTRTFKSSNGNMATVSGGDFGWKLSVTEETKAIIEAIKTGEGIHREPMATDTSDVYRENEIGDSYVEINLSSQYLWYYKDGKLITSGGVVTGDQRRGYSTPQGVYKLTYKQRNATLTGPGYSTPVSFWMPFNGGIGIHDATWRGSFGGSIYKTNGSHGCVNAPYSMAQAIFNSIDKSVPIICYY